MNVQELVDDAAICTWRSGGSFSPPAGQTVRLLPSNPYRLALYITSSGQFDRWGFDSSVSGSVGQEIYTAGLPYLLTRHDLLGGVASEIWVFSSAGLTLWSFYELVAVPTVSSAGVPPPTVEVKPAPPPTVEATVAAAAAAVAAAGPNPLIGVPIVGEGPYFPGPTSIRHGQKPQCVITLAGGITQIVACENRNAADARKVINALNQYHKFNFLYTEVEWYQAYAERQLASMIQKGWKLIRKEPNPPSGFLWVLQHPGSPGLVRLPFLTDDWIGANPNARAKGVTGHV